MEVHRLAAAGGIKTKLHAAAKCVAIDHSMNGRRVDPQQQTCRLPLFYPNRVSVIN